MLETPILQFPSLPGHTTPSIDLDTMEELPCHPKFKLTKGNAPKVCRPGDLECVGDICCASEDEMLVVTVEGNHDGRLPLHGCDADVDGVTHCRDGGQAHHLVLGNVMRLCPCELADGSGEGACTQYPLSIHVAMRF